MNARTDHPRAERLSAFLDEGLDARARAAVALHLESCPDCAGALAGLREVRDRARALPTVEAPAELWSAIETRLGPERARVLDIGAGREPRGRRWTFSTLQLAAAAAALVVVSAAGAWLAGRGLAPASPPAEAPVAAALPSADGAGSEPGESLETAPEEPPAAAPAGAATMTPRPWIDPDEPPGAAAATADFGLERYDTAIADLERILAFNRSRLNPVTVEVVERNLALIDQAIGEARRALAADPASPYLNDHLALTMKRKVDLLRRVTSAFQS